MTLPQDLICPAEEILDPVALSARLKESFEGAKDAAEVRSTTVATLRKVMKTGRATIAGAFEADPRKAHAATRSYAWLTDCLVRAVHEVATITLHPLPNPTTSESLAVLAVGGYGRFEMAPHSDVDLLFLTPYKITPWAESVIESMLYMLWDLRLKVGHSSRTVNDCLRLGREDYTIRTAMLEHRPVCGDAQLAGELTEQLWSELFKGTEAEFIEAKLAERSERHKKQGGQRYMVEPNVKEGKGGLRDLQTLFWAAKYVHGVSTKTDLVGLDMFTDEEFETFQQADEFLWAVRCHLHLITNRAADQLTFDLQVEVAERMGYADHGGRRAVEHFMQAYFRHATVVGDLTRIFLTGLEKQHLKKEPLLIGLLRRRRRVKAPFIVRHGRLTVKSDSVFHDDKLNLLRLFEEGLRTGVLIHPDAMRLVSANLDLIDDDMRTNKEAVRIFLDLLLKHGNPERALRRMNELGVLSAFIPEFEPIVAMMQFNMYHSYTVDEHTIQVISNFAQIERHELEDELPISSEIIAKGRQSQDPYGGDAVPRHRQGASAGSFDPGRQDVAPQDRPAAPVDHQGMRNRRMAGTPSPVDERHGAETRHRRPAHGARFRQGGKKRATAGPADGPDRLRHPRRRPERVEQLEGHADAHALQRADPARAGERHGGSEPREPWCRGETRPARGAFRLGYQGSQKRDRPAL